MTFSVRLADWDATTRPSLKSVRYEVFCVEQSVPEALEWDGIDAQCRHMRSPRTAQGRAIGCGRLLPDGHIGRMAVRAQWRGKGVGSALLERLIALAARARRCEGDAERADARDAVLRALRLRRRSASRSTRPDIPHQAMEAVLRARSR